MQQPDRRPPGRYGARDRPAGRATAVAVGLLGVAFVGWVVWAALGAATPRSRGEVTGFRVVSAEALEVRVAPLAGSSGRFSCTVRALDGTREVVGVAGVALDADGPAPRYRWVTIRTRDRAVAATVGACEPA